MKFTRKYSNNVNNVDITFLNVHAIQRIASHPIPSSVNQVWEGPSHDDVDVTYPIGAILVLCYQPLGTLISQSASIQLFFIRLSSLGEAFDISCVLR